MTHHDSNGVEQDISTLRFAYKDGHLFWELRSESVQHGQPKVSLLLNLQLNGVGEVQQTFPLSHGNQIQIVLWLAKQLGVELPNLLAPNRHHTKER
jgi:hypothetical protein